MINTNINNISHAPINHMWLPSLKIGYHFPNGHAVFKLPVCSYDFYISLSAYILHRIQILLTDWLVSLSCSSFPRQQAKPTTTSTENRILYILLLQVQEQKISLCAENNTSISLQQWQQAQARLSNLANTEFFMR